MARSTVEAKQILGDARMLSGAQDTQKITDADALVKLNTALNSIYTKLNGAKFRKFFSSFPVKSGSTLSRFIHTGSSAYTASTKTITNTSAAASWVGGLCAISDGSNVYFATVTGVSAGVSFTVSNGPTIDVASSLLDGVVFLPPSETSHSIEGYRVDNIVRIEFPNVGSGKKFNEDEFESAASNPNYDETCGYVHTGVGGNATVKFHHGSDVTNYGGYPVMFFEEKPYKATSTSSYVDLPTEYHCILVEEIARLMRIQLGQKVPKSLEDPMLTISAVERAFDETLAAFAKSSDKQ